MAELPIIRVPLEGATVEELTRVASERLRGEFFVPWEQPYPGGRVRVEATSEAVTPPAAVRGVATVRAAMRDGRKGLMARLINLDAESIRIPLGGLAPVVRVPTLITPAAAPAPQRAQKITKPAPVAGEAVKVDGPAGGGEDWDDPTNASRVPAQVAKSMKTPAPPEQRHVVRRNTPLPFPAVSRPPTAPLAAPTVTPAAAQTVPPAAAPQPKPPTVAQPTPGPVAAQTRPASVSPTEPPPLPPLTSLAPPAGPDDERETQAIEAEMPDLVIEEKSVPIEAPPLARAPVAAVTAPAPARAPVPAEVYAPPAPPKSMKPGQIHLAEIASSGPVKAPRRRPRPVVIGAALGAIALAILLVIILPSGDSAGGSPSALDEHIVQADARMREGRLTGPGGDQALDHLLEARKLAPDDARVHDRLTALADTFEQLADGAIAAGDLAEAATHLQAAINAQPDRASATTKLRDVEQRARDRQAGR